MAGGLLQLVAYGAQDQFLTGKPVITFFKAIYRQHTNFAMEFILQTIQGNFGKGKRVTTTIARHGDLLLDTWIHIKTKSTKDKFIDMNDVPRIIESVELEIGGQRIDFHLGHWLLAWNNLTNSKNKLDALVPPHSNLTDEKDSLFPEQMTKTDSLYIPLQFFFCRNPGLALPLIALQYHEVKINIIFNNDTIVDNIEDIELYSNYIYLDVDERRRFAQTSHQMLIDQLQYTEDNILSKSSLRINFNHPVKELIWVYQTDLNKWGYYDYDGKPDHVDLHAPLVHVGLPDPNPHKEFFTTAQLKLNNQDRFSPRPPEFFRFVQPYQFHTRVPHIPIYVYSFALKPEEHQPSGTCNFSRIDNAYLNFVKTDVGNGDPVSDGAGGTTNNISDLTIKLFAVNYNVLRITSGMGGLAFSN